MKKNVWKDQIDRKMALIFLTAVTLLVTAVVYGIRTDQLTVFTAGDYTYGEKNLPIYSVDTDEKKVALSFDAAWGNEDTGQILEILKKHDVHVTFFMTGGWVEAYPEDVKTILAAGHDLGNHSETHPNMSELSTEEMKQEVMAVHERVKELTGYEMELFRPPYGDYDNQVISTVYDCGYYPVQWSVDSLDWKDYGVQSVIDTVCNHKALENGAIILCHNGAKYTADALDQMITNLKDQGYSVVPVSELILKDNYYMDVTGKQMREQTNEQTNKKNPD